MITDSTSTFAGASPEGEPWVEILRARRKQRLREASLVLQSTGIPHSVDSRHNESVVLVPRWAIDRALEELELYMEENRGSEEEPALAPPAVGSGKGGAFAFAAVLATFFVLQRTDFGNLHWTWHGLASSQHIQQGEWWRTITALTLHADFFHLAANLLMGCLFFGLVCQILGIGVASWAVLLAGAIGNHAEALMRTGDHRSLGASTAVFGAVGVLAAASWQHRRRSRHSRLAQAAPIVVGVVLLAFYGMSGERTNILAHATGLGAGLLVGALFTRSQAATELPAAAQGVLAASALAFLGMCWWLALNP